jgi:hypothetical protein
VEATRVTLFAAFIVGRRSGFETERGQEETSGEQSCGNNSYGWGQSGAPETFARRGRFKKVPNSGCAAGVPSLYRS